MAASPAGVTRFGWRDTGRSGSSTKSVSLSLTKARLMIVGVFLCVVFGVGARRRGWGALLVCGSAAGAETVHVLVLACEQIFSSPRLRGEVDLRAKRRKSG